MKAKSAFRIATTVLRFKVRRLKLLNAHYFLTSRCNLKCSFCMRPLRSPELSTQEALKVVDGVCRLAIPFFHFSGGEPLLRKDLTLLAKRAADNGCIVGLSTNGTLFNQGKACEIARVFDQVYISLDSFAEIHDEYRGGGTFKKVVEAIEWLKSFGAKVGVCTVIASWNIEVLPDFIEWLRSRVDFVQVQPIHPYPPPPQNRPPSEALSRLLEYLLKLKRTDPNFMIAPTNFIKGIESFFDGKAPKICHAGELYVAIDPLGNLLACATRTDIVLGNVLDKPIDEILNEKTEAYEWLKIDTCQGCWLPCTSQTSMIMCSPFTEALHRISALMKMKQR